MKIKLTADTRVLQSAGTLVEVSKEEAVKLYRLGRCEYVPEKPAETKAEEPEADSEACEKAEAPKPKKKPAKRTASKAKKE